MKFCNIINHYHGPLKLYIGSIMEIELFFRSSASVLFILEKSANLMI